MEYFIIWNERKRVYQIRDNAEIICRVPEWDDVIDFLKRMYLQNKGQVLDIYPVNIYDLRQRAGLEVLVEKMRKREIN